MFISLFRGTPTPIMRYLSIKYKYFPLLIAPVPCNYSFMIDIPLNFMEPSGSCFLMNLGFHKNLGLQSHKMCLLPNKLVRGSY